MACRLGSSSKRPRQAHEEDASDSSPPPRIYVNADAERSAPYVQNRRIMQERGIGMKDFLENTVIAFGWQRFIRSPKYEGDRSLTHEFYTNYAGHPGDTVYLHGRQIPFSAAAINRHYRLPDIPDSPYQRLLQQGIDTDRLTICLTGQRQELGPAWRYIRRELLKSPSQHFTLFHI